MGPNKQASQQIKASNSIANLSKMTTVNQTTGYKSKFTLISRPIELSKDKNGSDSFRRTAEVNKKK